MLAQLNPPQADWAAGSHPISAGLISVEETGEGILGYDTTLHSLL